MCRAPTRSQVSFSREREGGLHSQRSALPFVQYVQSMCLMRSDDEVEEARSQEDIRSTSIPTLSEIEAHNVVHAGDGGRIVIDYHDGEELSRLMDLLRPSAS